MGGPDLSGSPFLSEMRTRFASSFALVSPFSDILIDAFLFSDLDEASP